MQRKKPRRYHLTSPLKAGGRVFGGYILRLRPLTFVNQVKFNLIPFIEVAIPFAVNGRVMNEDVLLNRIGGDEAISFQTAKPFNNSYLSFHFYLSKYTTSVRRRMESIGSGRLRRPLFVLPIMRLTLPVNGYNLARERGVCPE